MADLVTRQECAANVKMMLDKLEDICDKVDGVRLDVASLPEKIFEKGDERYATKTTEKLVYGMVGIVLTAVLLAIVYLVVNR